MKIKLLALDMDGTVLLDDHKSISERTRQAIYRAAAENILVVPSSGRIYSVLPEAVTALPCVNYAVTSNGAVVYHLKTQKVVYSNYLSRVQANTLLKILPAGLWAEIWYHGKIYLEAEKWQQRSAYALNPFHVNVLEEIGCAVNRFTDFLAGMQDEIEKINLPLIPPEQKQNVWNLLSACPDFSLVDTGCGIEVMRSGTSKLDGVRGLCHYFHQKKINISMENVLALGDSENDMEILQQCGLGVAMGNAVPAVQKIAKAVTLANTADGAALAIEKYALS